MRLYILSSIFRENICLQLTFESIETQFWVTKTVWQRIPRCNSKYKTAAGRMARLDKIGYLSGSRLLDKLVETS